MKIYKTSIMCFALCISMLFAGCAHVTNPDDTVPSDRVTLPTIPDIDSFNATTFEQYDYVFSSVKSATLYRDGTKMSIERDDPRLIRLLNALCYSYCNNYTGILQGMMEEAEINTCLNADVPKLDILLEKPNQSDEGNEITDAYRIVISANSYLLFVDPEERSVLDPTKLYAFQHWPYVVQLLAPYDNNSQESDAILNAGWGENTWIDLLSYAGFES